MTPKSYKTKFIEPGLISYNDQGAGTVLVSREALDRMAQSFRNCPVIFVPEHHDESDPETAFNFDDISANPASGIVTGFPYWEDGWQWVDVSIWDEGAQDAIDNKGFSVSCAYLVDDTGPEGKWHELLYDEEILNGHYMHMAIVPRPRYEGSQILANSKGGQGMAFFGIGKKNAGPFDKPGSGFIDTNPKKNAPAPGAAPAKEPDADNKPQMLNDDATVDVNGTPVALHELIAKYMETQGGAPQALAPEDEIALPDGSRVKVSELIAAYGAGESAEPAGEPMENAEPPQDVKGEAPNDEARQVRANAAPAPKPKVNAALKNAATKPNDFGQGNSIDNESVRLERGKARYSLPVKQGGK
jgi:hypothetical protein